MGKKHNKLGITWENRKSNWESSFPELFWGFERIEELHEKPPKCKKQIHLFQGPSFLRLSMYPFVPFILGFFFSEIFFGRKILATSSTSPEATGEEPHTGRNLLFNNIHPLFWAKWKETNQNLGVLVFFTSKKTHRFFISFEFWASWPTGKTHKTLSGEFFHESHERKPSYFALYWLFNRES